MKIVGESEFHRVSVETSKNRLYLYFRGKLMMKSYEVLKEAPDQVRQACRLLSQGFTVFCDLREVSMFGLPDLARDVQEAHFKAGTRKAAIVWNQEGFTTFLLDGTARDLSESYAKKRRNFVNGAEAEAWLDQ